LALRGASDFHGKFSPAGGRANRDLRTVAPKRKKAKNADLRTREHLTVDEVEEWAQAGVTGAITTMMLVRGLVERDTAGGLKMTPRGREVFNVLIDR
jgi:hypothetical protein